MMNKFVDQKVHSSEMQDIFQFLQIDPHDGCITRSTLKQKLEPLFGTKLTDYDVDCMMLGQDTLPYPKLMELLMDNDSGNAEEFNPIQSALHLMFDTKDTGFLDRRRLLEMFEMMGFETITKRDIVNMVKQCSANKDGSLSIASVCNMIFRYDLQRKCNFSDQQIDKLGLKME